MYELAKISVNNKGNEIKSCERRSGDLREINSQPDGLGDHGSHIPDDNLGNIVNEEENQLTQNQD